MAYGYDILVGSKTPNSGFEESSKSATDEIDELFKLLDDFCTNDQLRQLIRVYRPTDKDFHLTGKRDQLRSSVRRLFDTGHLRRGTLDTLLERAEENGRQHIYLYIPSSEDVGRAMNEFTAVERVLLHGKTRDDAGLPKFLIRPDGVVPADLRLERRTGTKYSFWVYKLYAGVENWRLYGEPKIVEEGGDEIKLVRYKKRYTREVFVAKWHSFGLLEIRIPIGNSQQQLIGLRQHLRSLISRAVFKVSNESSGSVAQDLVSIRSELEPNNSRRGVREADAEIDKLFLPLPIPVTALDSAARSKDIAWIAVNKPVYDKDGIEITVAPPSSDEDLYETDAMADVLKGVTECKRLNAVVHFKQTPEFPEKIAIEFCPQLAHELRIAAETSPEVVEFLIRRIWELAQKPAILPPSPVDDIASDKPSSAGVVASDFERLAREHPYLANAILRLLAWIKAHPTADLLEGKRLQKALGGGLKSTDFAVAVAKMLEEGLLVQKYRVKLEGKRKPLEVIFDSVDDLLNSNIKDEDGEDVDLNTALVYPVYGKAGAQQT